MKGKKEERNGKKEWKEGKEGRITDTWGSAEGKLAAGGRVT